MSVDAWEMWKKEMENDNVVMCFLEEESMSGKTTMQWHVNRRNKRKAQKNWYHLIFTTSMLSKHHHALGHPSCLTVPEVIKDENEPVSVVQNLDTTQPLCHAC